MTGLFEFALQLRAAHCREVSELPELWTPDNPSTGTCHVSALCIQDRFGGTIMEGVALPRTLHYWNVIDGMTLDVTRDQFPADVEIVEVFPAFPPNATTRAKADLLLKLAFPEAVAA